MECFPAFSHGGLGSETRSPKSETNAAQVVEIPNASILCSLPDFSPFGIS
jgi:hypothetical protein